MSLLDWAFYGAIFIGVMVFCLRLMRKGITSLDERRGEYLERIRAEERKLDEDVKNISSAEHLKIMKAALIDLLRLDGNPQGYSVTDSGRVLTLVTPQGCYEIKMAMAEKSLATSSRVLHGRVRWSLSGFGKRQEYSSAGKLMSDLNKCLHPDRFEQELQEENKLSPDNVIEVSEPNQNPVSMPPDIEDLLKKMGI